MRLYSTIYIFFTGITTIFYQLEEVLKTAIDSNSRHSKDLKKLDQQRTDDPYWYKSHNHLGGAGYADLMAGSIKGLEAKIPYMKELQSTYFHLLPFFDYPDGENDGGYAVSDYRTFLKDLRHMADLRSLSGKLRSQGISLCADFVFNYTS